MPTYLTYLTDRQMAVLYCHASKNDAAARLLVVDDNDWNKLCGQLVEHGFLEWLKTYEHTGQPQGWGIASKTVTYTRVLTEAGHAALKEQEVRHIR